MSSVDIVVPCYNYGRYLRQCVESALLQDGVEVRVLIIDDCSTDNTREVGQELAAEDSRVTYRRHDTNQGHIATYNEGFEWASGDATLLISADDLLVQGALGRAAKIMDSHPEVGLVYGRQIAFSEQIPVPKLMGNAACEVITGSELIQRMCVSGSNPVTTPTAVVRTTTLHQIGGYNRALPHTADMEYWLRVAARSSIGIVAADQAYKRCHTANMQIEFVTQKQLDLKQRLAAFDSFFNRDAHLLTNAPQLHQLARRSLANQAFWAASEAFDRGCNADCETLLEIANGLEPAFPNNAAGDDWRGNDAWECRMAHRPTASELYATQPRFALKQVIFE